jgi:hypothetical protein
MRAVTEIGNTFARGDFGIQPEIEYPTGADILP